MSSDQLHVDIATRIQAQSLSEAGCADVVVVAADGGDVNTLTDYLTHHPDHVHKPCITLLGLSPCISVECAIYLVM